MPVPSTFAGTTSTPGVPSQPPKASWNPSLVVGGLVLLAIAALVLAVRRRTKKRPRTVAAYRTAGTEAAVVSVAFLVGLVAVPEHLSSGRRVFVVLLCVVFVCAILAVLSGLRSELRGAREPKLEQVMANERDILIKVTNLGVVDTYRFNLRNRDQSGPERQVTWESNKLHAVELPPHGHDWVTLPVYVPSSSREMSVDLILLTNRQPSHVVGLVLRKILGRVECRWEKEPWPPKPEVWRLTLKDLGTSGLICRHNLQRIADTPPIDIDAMREQVRKYRDEILASGLDIPEGVLADARPTLVDYRESETRSDELMLQVAIRLVEEWRQTLAEALDRVSADQVAV